MSGCYFDEDVMYFNGVEWVSISDYKDDMVLSLSNTGNFCLKKPACVVNHDSVIDNTVSWCFDMPMPLCGSLGSVRNFVRNYGSSELVYDGSYVKNKNILRLFALAVALGAEAGDGCFVFETDRVSEILELVDINNYPYKVCYKGGKAVFTVTDCYIVNAILATGVIPCQWYNLSLSCKKAIIDVFDTLKIGGVYLSGGGSYNISSFIQYVYATSGRSAVCRRHASGCAVRFGISDYGSILSNDIPMGTTFSFVDAIGVVLMYMGNVFLYCCCG